MTFFVLLLMGYSQLFSYIYHGIAFEIPQKSTKCSERHATLQIKSAEVEDIFIEEEEEERNERGLFKKFFENASIAIAISDVFAPLSILENFTAYIPFEKDSSGIASHGQLHIILGVLRI